MPLEKSIFYSQYWSFILNFIKIFCYYQNLDKLWIKAFYWGTILDWSPFIWLKPSVDDDPISPLLTILILIHEVSMQFISIEMYRFILTQKEALSKRVFVSKWVETLWYLPFLIIVLIWAAFLRGWRCFIRMG